MKPELSQVWTFQFFLFFLFDQPFQRSQLPLVRLADAGRDCLGQFFVLQEALRLSVSNKPIDRFNGKLTPLFRSEYFFLAHSDASKLEETFPGISLRTFRAWRSNAAVGSWPGLGPHPQ